MNEDTGAFLRFDDAALADPLELDALKALFRSEEFQQTPPRMIVCPLRYVWLKEQEELGLNPWDEWAKQITGRRS